MYYKIKNDTVEQISKDDFEMHSGCIGVFKSDEWKESQFLKDNMFIFQDQAKIHFCKVESYSDYIYGTFCCPIKKNNIKNLKFMFYILNDLIIFIDDTGAVDDLIMNMNHVRSKKEYTMERFLFDFFSMIIDEDLITMENIESRLESIESKILSGDLHKINDKIIPIKRRISSLHRYYNELTQVADELDENQMDVFSNNTDIFKILSDRAERLLEEAQCLRDYAGQVQDVYESEISIRQNEIMKTMTIVATIFLPLTFIAGWYGMNFTYMPELSWKMGYPLIILICITITVCSMWYFKKKKFW